MLIGFENRRLIRRLKPILMRKWISDVVYSRTAVSSFCVGELVWYSYAAPCRFYNFWLDAYAAYLEPPIIVIRQNLVCYVLQWISKTKIPVSR